MNNNTSIRYEEVKNSVNVIRDECLVKMKNIFENFNSAMKTVGGEDVFVGDANETFQSRYNQLSTKFQEFENLVNRFAAELEGASEATSEAEQKLSAAAESLNSGN